MAAVKTQDEVMDIVKDFAAQLSASISDKLNSVILFGSYARGDYEQYSDVDVMVLLNVPHEETPNYEKIIRDIASPLEFDNEILMPVVSESIELFEDYLDASGFFKNVIKDGVKISV